MAALRTRIKICGITSIEDAQAAIAAGADALGFVFYRASPRAVDAPQAAAIIRSMPPFVQRVGLWVDPEEWEVRDVLARVPLDLLQFHGQESPAFCRSFGRSYLKAVRMAPDVDVPALAACYDDAAGLLLDTHVPGVPGGTGLCFDWTRVPPVARPWVLAGGLHAGNVAQAIEALHPYAVDVSGGVERAKGSKDPASMRAFVAAVRKADEQRD